MLKKFFDLDIWPVLKIIISGAFVGAMILFTSADILFYCQVFGHSFLGSATIYGLVMGIVLNVLLKTTSIRTRFSSWRFITLAGYVPTSIILVVYLFNAALPSNIMDDRIQAIGYIAAMCIFWFVCNALTAAALVFSERIRVGVTGKQSAIRSVSADAASGVQI